MQFGRILTSHQRWFHRVASLRALPRRTSSHDEMEQLGASIAAYAAVGDVFFLKGDLGCGKTCFARGFIRRLTKDDALHVTSPTYLLVNTYESAQKVPLFHVDLYRLDAVSAKDTQMLGLDEAFANGITLIEWPERLEDKVVPSDRVEVNISYDAEDQEARIIQIEAFGERWLK